MTEDEAREIAEDLLDLVDKLPAKTGGSGLVAQQRLFRRVGVTRSSKPDSALAVAGLAFGAGIVQTNV